MNLSALFTVFVVSLIFMYLYGAIATLSQAELDYNNCSTPILVISRILEYTLFLPVTLSLCIISIIVLIIQNIRAKHRTRKKP